MKLQLYASQYTLIFHFICVNYDSPQERKVSAVGKHLKSCGFKRTLDILVLYLDGYSGALKYLCVLQVLFLHDNQLKNLGKTVKGLKGMISLQTLNLFHNHLAQDPGYWVYVIHLLPSVQLLDRKIVTQKERELAFHLYHHKRSRVMQSIAFGKRVDTSVETTVGSSRCTQPSRRVMMPSGSEFGNQRNKEPFENPEDAVLLRAMARSVMEFSYVDWNNVATSQERRLENKTAAEACKKLTVRFR
ncbi:LOW QUALITY PROTEIN: leucine-rich repeat-containing protein 72 [Melopsittacus undulatus]|uniref:LOW QUALITY PROTEIN: leucine-rich repeat-containing protein 72 n=1 Tax=Melopsittacus undulatus TaxID=13146 RepID=UPI00146EFF69|nr:LOW QUALITY PROTEIN: leucine-rich repeat-containing protein 72 [Melopsittacus undulatus]